MSLSAGTRLGPYEIQTPLGAGGMGEVYRARDTRLDRTVAIKVLPADVAEDAAFQQRFQAEARAISQLTHPHICTLHDIGEHDGTTFLVMELLTGETLADRLARGTPEQPALPLDAALQIGIQIADALAAAHQHGIIHRDLKPGNVMLTTAAGPSVVPHAKLLDFGLAKATAVATSTLSQAPTTPPLAATVQGTILGTIQYMAPEQIEGGIVDARSDIFAFGSVLYEMLTGRKAFEGKTQASVMAAILEREPPSVSALQPRVPGLVEATVAKCLAKNPDNRWQSAADLATALRWATTDRIGGAQSAAASSAVGSFRSRVARRLGIAAAVVASAAVGAWGGSRYLSGRAPAPEPVFVDVLPPVNALFSPSPVAATAQLALSPDGRRLAFVAAPRRGVSMIWVRRLDSPQAQPLAGTEGASFPFWSPDGRFLAYYANGKLRKVDISAGAPQALADASNGRGGAWSPTGQIVFTASPISPISRVSASGGAVTQETTLDAKISVTHYWPQFLPDGRRFLYYQFSSDPDQNGVYVKTLGVADATRVLAHSGAAVYTPGYLLYVRDGTLFAVAFDDRQLVTRGDPIRVGDRVGHWNMTFGYVAVSASANGAVAYGPSVVLTTHLQWHDRTGAIVGTPTAPSLFRSPRLSPDGKRAAVALISAEDGASDIWLLELARGALSRMTFSPAADWFPAWGPDVQRVYFAATRSGPSTIYQKLAGAQGEGEQVTETATSGQYPMDVTNDGEYVAIQQTTTGGQGYDITVLRLREGKTGKPFLASRFNEIQARFSPDGRWMAYASDESGRFEVYVRPFPAAGEQLPISVGGGTQPEWRRDGKELFYISADGKLMAVDVVSSSGALTAGVARRLFDVEIPEPSAPYANDYAVSANGQSFLVNTVVDQPTLPTLSVILNWASSLKQR